MEGKETVIYNDQMQRVSAGLPNPKDVQPADGNQSAGYVEEVVADEVIDPPNENNSS